MNVLDAFPARVVVVQGDTETVYERARVFVYQGRAVLFEKDRMGPIAIRLDHQGATIQTAGRKVWTVTTEGSTWTVTKTGGCGCSDPLKAIKPMRFLAERDSVTV